ncbi:MAG: hypothetical protein MJ075_06485 [Oscillospiraceae bacterium]|nr:hypothetical protein [Oscillospiraceae bacterium]
MNPVKRSLRAFGLLAGSYALLSLLYILPVDSVLMLRRTSSVFYLLPAVLFWAYFATRIIDRRMRRFLSAVGAMILIWSLLRAAKFIAFEENGTISRFLWYLFYIPMLYIPQLSFQAALSIDRPPEKKLPPVQLVTGVLSLLCILLVLTNDYHQQVFSFRPGFAGWDWDYDHRPLFWIITVWAWLFFLYSTIILFLKCRLSASRKLTWIPIAYMGLGITGLYLLNIGRLPVLWGSNLGEFQDIACYTMGGFWILCITIGLVPSNKGYETLFRESSLAASITDLDFKPVYQSKSALPLTKEQRFLPGPVTLNDNTIVYRSPVSGGFAFRQVDITELNRINRQLEETRDAIAEENELVRQANALQEHRAQISAKNAVYDAIALRVLPQSREISRLASCAEEDSACFEHSMRQISLYAAYIKRLSNLMLLASDEGMKRAELDLALAESLRYLNKAGIPAELFSDSDECLCPSEALIDAYALFEALLEQALPTLQALQVTLSGKLLKLTFEGASLILPDMVNGTIEREEGVSYVRLSLGEEVDLL